MIIEFYWSNKLIWFLLQFIFGIIINTFNSSFRDNDVNIYTSLLYESISESSLLFSIIFFFIQNRNMKHENYSKQSIVNHIIKKNENINIKIENTKNHKTIFFFPKTDDIYNQYKLFFMIIFTSLFKFAYTFFYYFISSDKFFDNFNSEINLCYNAFYIFSFFSIIICSKFLFKRKFYKHHLFAIISMSLISIILFFINYKIIYMRNNIQYKHLIILGFFNIVINILVGIMYVFYKYLMEIHFISFHVINFYEGILISIYTLLLFLVLKLKNKVSFEFNILYLIISCIYQISMNFVVKYIIYIFNDMYAIIPSYITYLYEIGKNLYINKSEKENIKNLVLYYFLCLIEGVIYLLLIFLASVFIEVVIIKLCGLEENTLKYLKKKQKEDIILKDINMI